MLAAGGAGGGLKKRPIPKRTSQPTPKPSQVADLMMDRMTPEKLAENFRGGEEIWKDVSSIPSGLMGMLDTLNKGYTPQDIAEPIVEETIQNILHPVDYFKEHPGFALMDLIGLGTGATKAFTGAAGRVGLTPRQFLDEDIGAVGNIGRRMEAGETPTELIPGPKLFSGGATEPYMLTGRLGDNIEEFVGKRDPANKYYYSNFHKQKMENQNQALSEAVSSELNAYAGGNLRMPAVQRTDLPVEGSQYVLGMRQNTSAPGSLLEYIPDLQRAGHIDDLDWANPQTAEQMRLMNLMDRISGNQDRILDDQMVGSSNFHMTADRVPVAVDQGYGFRPSERFIDDTFQSSRAWSQSPQGEFLNPAELEWVQRLLRGMEDQATPAVRELTSLGANRLRGPLERAREILEQGRLESRY